MILLGGSLQKLKEGRIKKYGCIEPIGSDHFETLKNNETPIKKDKMQENIESDLNYYDKLKIFA